MESSKGDGSPSIALELELGTGCSKRSYGFTIFQLQELQLQSLIFKYMEAGLPVPSQLVIPIWKSVASSVSGLSGDLHQLYPSCKYPDETAIQLIAANVKYFNCFVVVGSSLWVWIIELGVKEWHGPRARQMQKNRWEKMAM